MFNSFFPRPKQFFLSACAWGLFCVLLWFFAAKDWGPQLSMGSVIGVEFPAELAEELTDSSDEAATAAATAATAAHAEATDHAVTIWHYQYQVLSYLLFGLVWMFLTKHKWARWSVLGSCLIIFVVWFQVHIDVLINEWFGGFYNTIQAALGDPEAVSAREYYGYLLTFSKLAGIWIVVAVLNSFFVSHYVFRWRNAMNDYYMSVWDEVRHIEGASQRVQEDTAKFAAITESLGVRFIDSIMTLIAFLPILWGLSIHIKALPVVGPIAQGLVWVAILWSVFGTGILALVGIKLPGLEFRNQRVEAAYRKELVYGEDDPEACQPPTIKSLFSDVRINRFRMILHYTYFNIARSTYNQVGAILPYVILGPTIIAAGFTLGIMQQTLRAFGRVENSFQFLVNSWTTIVELMSIHKRLKAFEATITGDPLSKIDKDFMDGVDVRP